MENHPIPQDITGFQFKLIGDMTIKQFAYLAGGIILGWVTYILPIIIFVKVPVLLTFVGLGVAAAFLPIEGRPFDVMIGNYFKALFSPTQYIYQKIGGLMWFPDAPIQNQKTPQNITPGSNADSSQKLKEFLKSLPQKPKNKLDEKEMNFLSSLGFSSADTAPTTSMEGTAYNKLFSNQHPINLPQPMPEVNKEPDVETETKLNLEKAEFEQKSEFAKAQKETQVGSLDHANAYPNLTTPIAVAPKQENQTISHAEKGTGKAGGLPFVSDVPNLVMGVIKGPRQNPLGNIMVEIKDKNGNPVRAFKTDSKGQFASATPLGIGTYTISFEDPKRENKFSTIELKTEGNVLMPLEITSLDQREELRQSLFSAKN